jgi:hypothetical protein
VLGKPDIPKVIPTRGLSDIGSIKTRNGLEAKDSKRLGSKRLSGFRDLMCGVDPSIQGPGSG